MIIPARSWLEKVADFKIKINSIKAELTDDWVKANSDKSKTVAEYKKK